MGPRVRTVRFQEFQRPTIMKANANADLPVQGLFWIDEATGRVVKTELDFGLGRITPEVVTLFKFDEELGLNVPAEMRDWYPTGTASSAASPPTANSVGSRSEPTRSRQALARAQASPANPACAHSSATVRNRCTLLLPIT